MEGDAAPLVKVLSSSGLPWQLHRRNTRWSPSMLCVRIVDCMTCCCPRPSTGLTPLALRFGLYVHAPHFVSERVAAASSRAVASCNVGPRTSADLAP